MKDTQKKINIICIIGMLIILIIGIIYSCNEKKIEFGETSKDMEITATPIQEIYLEGNNRYVVVKDSEGFPLAALWDEWNYIKEKTYQKLWMYEKKEWISLEDNIQTKYIMISREVILLLPEGSIEFYKVPKE